MGVCVYIDCHYIDLWLCHLKVNIIVTVPIVLSFTLGTCDDSRYFGLLKLATWL